MSTQLSEAIADIDIVLLFHLEEFFSEEEIERLQASLSLEVLLRLKEEVLPTLLSKEELDYYKKLTLDNPDEAQVVAWFKSINKFKELEDRLVTVKADVTRECIVTYVSYMEKAVQEDNEKRSAVATDKAAIQKMLQDGPLDMDALSTITDRIQTIVYG